ncbi:DUF29 domain-containing protein [Myxacorys almedinensis]|uniref:DUF29 family protein n=1 Tax=Myxacorys almedinensis A TaxID=2690445 RepID=A0A8J8CHP2_9CYAN|nr:DUF29 domain-containing protein [Myxacorys almedinensis]NDJ16879.1 DUF29 family protein [Myxacorys almedinensis A]
MNTDLESRQSDVYEADYFQWIESTIQKLKHHDYSSVDWKNVIEELEGMARRERQRLRSNLIVLLVHLLKWHHQPNRRSGSWKGSIVEHRQRIEDIIEDSPSLNAYPSAVLEKCYRNAVAQAAAETGLSPETFPQACPYSISEVLDTKFLPE